MNFDHASIDIINDGTASGVGNTVSGTGKALGKTVNDGVGGVGSTVGGPLGDVVGGVGKVEIQKCFASNQR